ncbi:hypothetical protein M407DRAFT_11319 [Tulasnella calospora MUT 4182]|uniref:Uncharacterized protein n=1 Tax=Tulasnella calospora MUT 4182 TaxID=1051891 RepID=A0A0C3LDR1_9AGAM|nr:hypothetical protein M407DRAFT_11319 [Tulasnella calospora MUT 4182]
MAADSRGWAAPSMNSRGEVTRWLLVRFGFRGATAGNRVQDATLSWLQANRIIYLEDRIKDKAVQDIIAFCDVKNPNFNPEITPKSSGLGISSASGTDDLRERCRWT